MVTKKSVAWSLMPLTLAALLLGLGARSDPPRALAGDGTVTRPISDFVNAQGTYCIDDGMGGCLLFVPPVDNYIGWTDPRSGLALSIDYAGIADDYYGGAFGTTFTGTITERPLADGRAEVTVLLHTRNALTYVVDGFDFAASPLLFGARPTPDGLEGNGALGDCLLAVKFINTAPGAPMPDLLQLLIDPVPGQEPLAIGLKAATDGEWADGTPGRAEMAQTGLFFTNANGNSRVALDGFPAEYIKLSVVGK